MKNRSVACFSICLLTGTLLAACTFGGTGTTNKPTPYPTGDTVHLITTPVGPLSVSTFDTRPVIIDTDMATDDWLAILYLLHRPDVDVQAIMVTGAGEAHCDPGVSNALGLVGLASQTPVAVACGQETPLRGNHVFPQGWRDFVDNLAGLTLPEATNPVTGIEAVQLLTQILQSSPEKVTILALGPLTNIAAALQSEPGLAENIERIYIMGGAVNVPGNLGTDVVGNITAEWNIYIDPYAANVVFASGIPATLVGLDATNQAPLTMTFFRRLESTQNTSSAIFVFDVLSQMQDFMQFGNYYFWDPLAAGIMVDESLASYQDYPLCVVEDEGPESGRTVVSDGCPSVRVAVSAEGARFEQNFLETLNSLPVQEAADFSLIAGTWSGTARNGDFEMQISVTIFEDCQAGQVCGNFDNTTLPCVGDFEFVGMNEGLFEFAAVNKQGTCGEGQDFFQPQEDGTLLYLSRGDYGETQGILQKVNP